MAKDVRVILSGDAGGAVRAFDDVTNAGKKTADEIDQLDKAQKQSERSAVSMASAYGTVAGAMAALGIGKLVSDLYNVNAEFGRLKATLTTVTGSQAMANAEFARLEDFASKTPYQLNEVVEAATRLSALNLDSSTASLESYGNTASAMGKSMIDMIEAVADASTGEFERLKEFGIKASKEGDKIVFTFRGVKTEVANNATAIQEHLLKLGKTDFAGGMQRQLDKIGGAASNLADTYDKLLRKTGETLPIKGSIQGATKALELLTENLDAAVAGMTAMTATAVIGNLGTISALMRTMAGSATLIAAGSAGLVGLVGAGAYALGTAIDRTFDLSGVVAYEAEMKRAEEIDKRLAEAMNKKNQAAAKASADKETSARDAVEKAKVREKALEEIRKHNDRILDVEKKRIQQSLAQEEQYLAELTKKYEAASAALDSIVDAKKAVQSQLASRDAADAAKNAFDVDPLNAYLNKQDELDASIKKIDDSWSMSAEDKAKAYANLIDQASGYNQAVVLGSTEIISGYQAEHEYQARKESLQEKINQLIGEEEDKRFNAAVALAEQQISAQEKAEAFRQEVENIETVLDRLNNKEVNIIFKAQGAEQIMRAAGYSGNAWDQGSDDFVGPSQPVGGFSSPSFSSGASFISVGDLNSMSFAVGTSYIPKTGLYQLHRGEEVRTRGEVSSDKAPVQINFSPTITIQGGTPQQAEQTVREMERILLPRLRTMMRERYA